MLTWPTPRSSVHAPLWHTAPQLPLMFQQFFKKGLAKRCKVLCCLLSILWRGQSSLAEYVLLMRQEKANDLVCQAARVGWRHFECPFLWWWL